MHDSNEITLTAVYAFAAWITSIVGYLIFLVWAFTPDVILHSYGISYYPNRYYCVAIPAYALVMGFLVNLAYVSVNLLITAPPDALSTIRDAYTNPISDKYYRIDAKGELPEMGDLDPSRVIYSKAKSMAHR